MKSNSGSHRWCWGKSRFSVLTRAPASLVSDHEDPMNLRNPREVSMLEVGPDCSSVTAALSGQSM